MNVNSQVGWCNLVKIQRPVYTRDAMLNWILLVSGPAASTIDAAPDCGGYVLVLHYYTTALWILSGTTRVSRYRKGKTRRVKSVCIYWTRDREWQWHQLGYVQIYTPPQRDYHANIPPLSFFTGRMPFLPPNQQRQSTEGYVLVKETKYHPGNRSWYQILPLRVRWCTQISQIKCVKSMVSHFKWAYTFFSRRRHGQTWRHPQNRKYMTYHNAATAGYSHSFPVNTTSGFEQQKVAYNSRNKKFNG